MIGFTIMMCFVAIVLILVSVALLKGNHSSIHGKVYDNTDDKAGYAKALGKPVMLLGVLIGASGIIAVVINSVIVSFIIILCAAISTIAWAFVIQNRFR